ncbi:MAG: hypothetical protein ACYSW8_29705 [Planctomycetota bacterium]|jgi:hypothetical protein
MMNYDIHIANFAHGRRGPMSAILVRRSDGAEAFGTIFYNEVFPDQQEYPIVTSTRAQEWLDSNAETIWDGLCDLDDDGIYPGWAENPRTENLMLDRARQEAGW